MVICYILLIALIAYLIFGSPKYKGCAGILLAILMVLILISLIFHSIGLTIRLLVLPVKISLELIGFIFLHPILSILLVLGVFAIFKYKK